MFVKFNEQGEMIVQNLSNKLISNMLSSVILLL